MSELIEAIKAWPIIVQGALGSALFWAILLISQVLFENFSKLYSKHSASSRVSFLVSKLAKYDAFINGDAFSISTVIYRSTRFFYKSLMWLVLGLIFQLFIPDVGVIGFVGCLYYLIKAYQIIKPWDKDEEKNIEEERKKVIKELRETGNWPEEKN